MSIRPNTDCLIAFGSNLGAEESVLQQAITHLQSHPEIRITGASRPVWTAAVGGPEGQSDYLNAAIRLETTFNPQQLLLQTRKIETGLGRERRQRWGARRIDLDILLFGEQQVDSLELTIPHPRMSFRRFVLEPAAEIAAEMTHPVCQRSIGQLLEHLNQKPNEIIWAAEKASANEVFRSLLRDVPMASAWTVHRVETTEDFERYRDRAKLVIWGNPLPKQLQSVSFQGPVLRLPPADDQVLMEISAAMLAMTEQSE